MFREKDPRPSLRTLGRRNVPNHWHERCERGCRRMPRDYRVCRSRMTRHRANHHLRSWIASGRILEEFEPRTTKRDNLVLFL